MNYGYFDDANREYVITDPRTPVKWINYIGDRTFGGFVDQTGGALICSQDPALNRITRYVAQMPASDFRGETLYLRLRRGGSQRIVTPFFVPGLQSLDRFECRVGLGVQRILSEAEGIRCEVTIFVPQGGMCELRDIQVTNLSDRPLTVDAVPVVEYSHFDSLKQFTNADWVPQTMQSRAVETEMGRVLLQYAFMLRDLRVNYFASSLPSTSYETDRRQFLGANEYGGWGHPLSLDAPQLGNHEALRGDNLAVLLIPLGEFQPGETRRLVTQLGQAASLEDALPQIRKNCNPPAVDAALQALTAFWEDYLSHQQVHTPDADFDRMLNIHNPRQCFITQNWSRDLSLYQLGYGTRGIGYRDSNQDVMAVFASIPDQGKDLLRRLLAVQKRDGSAMHQFNPLSLVASEGDSLERADRPHYYSDDALWSVLAVTAYLKETGDLGFLDECISYYDKDTAGQALENGTVRDHLRRALAFTRGDVGAHGLPLLGFADWNDTVNLPRGAESLFTANLYGRALLEMIALCDWLGGAEEAQQLHLDYAAMRQRVESAGWDGAWYRRYYDPDGAPLGSHLNEHGQIYVNAQSWAVLSGFAASERARMAMDAVYERLNTSFGIKLSAPGFNGFDPAVGGITTYPPGAKENGGIFLHANPWAVIAETLLGRGDRAYQYYRQINPSPRNDQMGVYEAEPYVYPQNILGDEHPQFGLARNTWLSGTASWAYQAGTQYILGIQPDYNGLRVDPCIPAGWDGFSADRIFRGARYRIRVHNPDHVCRGVARFSVDGQTQPGCTAPIFPAGEMHTLNVWLGNVSHL